MLAAASLLLRFWQLALGAAAVAALVVFYEGIPFIKDGRVDRAHHSGVREEANRLEEARRRAELARAVERQRAAIEIARLEQDLVDREDRAAVEQKELSDELERALAKADLAACRAIPDDVLAPLRRLGPS